MIERFKEIPLVYEITKDEVNSYGSTYSKSTGKLAVKIVKACFNEPYIETDPDDGTQTLTVKSLSIAPSSLIQEIPDWGKIKTMYFDTSCIVPGYRLEEFCTKKEVKVVRDKTKADITLVGRSFLAGLIEKK